MQIIGKEIEADGILGSEKRSKKSATKISGRFGKVKTSKLEIGMKGQNSNPTYPRSSGSPLG